MIRPWVLTTISSTSMEEPARSRAFCTMVRREAQQGTSMRAMVRLLGTLGNDSNLRITLDWGDSAGTIRFGTPEDIWYNPDYTNGYYGVGIAVEMDSYMEAAEADLNYDGIVNFGDFAVMADYWLMFTSNPMADIVPFPYGDSFVDMFDLQILAEQWLAPSP